MRVLQLMAGARHGGAETFFDDLIAALARRGVAQMAMTRPYPDRVARLADSGCRVATARFGSPIDLISRFKVSRAAQQFAPDVVLVWMNRAASFAPTGRHVVVGRLGGYYDLKYYRRCDALICNTADIRAYALAGGWPAERVHYIPNFSPAPPGAAVDRAALSTAASGPVILVLARLTRSKGVDVAINALARVPGATLWIAGEGVERESLARVALAAGVTDRVRFLGWRDDRSALLRAADVCVVASRDEPFGNVVVNAWAHGVPLVATKTKGPAALVRDDVNGLLVAVDDPAEMAQGIARLLADRPLARRLAEAGLARARDEFSEDRVVTQYMSVLEAVRRGRSPDLPTSGGGA